MCAGFDVEVAAEPSDRPAGLVHVGQRLGHGDRRPIQTAVSDDGPELTGPEPAADPGGDLVGHHGAALCRLPA